MELGLTGKRVFVTASSAGIGLAIARCFLEEGCRVVINGRDESKLKQVCHQLKNRFGEERVWAFAGDMTEEESVAAVRDFIREELQQLDVLVGNQGSGKPQGTDPYAYGEWHRLLECNLLANVLLADYLAGIMAINDGASIVYTTSIAGREYIGAPPAYAAAKAGLEILIKDLARTLADAGIRVNGIAPGNICFKGGRWEELMLKDHDGVTSMLEKSVPLKRFGHPSEIAKTVVFLASSASSFTNGTVFVVDGGQSTGY